MTGDYLRGLHGTGFPNSVHCLWDCNMGEHTVPVMIFGTKTCHLCYVLVYCFCVFIIFHYQAVAACYHYHLFSHTPVTHSFPVITRFPALVFPCDVSVFMFGSEHRAPLCACHLMFRVILCFWDFGKLPSFYRFLDFPTIVLINILIKMNAVCRFM